MSVLGSMARVLMLLAALGVALFLFSVWQSWKAYTDEKEMFSGVKKGMPEKALLDMAESKKGRVRRLGKDDNGINQFIILKSGGGQICRIVVSTKDGFAVDSFPQSCMD